MSREIPLSKGYVAVIDDEDAGRVERHKWHVSVQSYRSKRTIYAQRKVREATGRRTIMLHRFIMELEPGDTRECDHRDGNGLDNRRHNLRIVTHQQNHANRRPYTRCEFKGVSRSKNGRFRAVFRGKGIGTFDTAIEAALAFNNAAQKADGEFAYLNPLV